jgi:hypothetical protein
MKKPFCEILCSPEVAREIGLRKSGWILTKAGFGFENWELHQNPKSAIDFAAKRDKVTTNASKL